MGEDAGRRHAGQAIRPLHRCWHPEVSSENYEVHVGKKIAKRSRIKPFIKCVNYNHLMPTRYSLDIELKSVVTTDIVAGSNPTARSNCRKDVKKLLEDKYNTCVQTGKNKW